jgi:hypothetical protein
MRRCSRSFHRISISVIVGFSVLIGAPTASSLTMGNYRLVSRNAATHGLFAMAWSGALPFNVEDGGAL